MFHINKDQITVECERFNRESLEYFYFKYSQLVFNSNFSYIEHNQDIETNKLISTVGKKIYFIRFAQSIEKGKDAYITILNEKVSLPEQYNHQFVFAEWDIDKEQLAIYSEFQRAGTLIMKQKFYLNIL